MLTRERPLPSVGQLAPVHFVNAVEMALTASSNATCLLASRCTLYATQEFRQNSGTPCVQQRSALGWKSGRMGTVVVRQNASALVGADANATNASATAQR